MKQQTKKPPKAQCVGVPTNPAVSVASSNNFQPISSKRNGLQVGKENTADGGNKIIPTPQPKLSITKMEQDQNQKVKQRFKSNGGNRSASQQETKRPATACQQSKLPSPQSDIQLLGLKNLHQTLNNTSKLVKDLEEVGLEQSGNQNNGISSRNQEVKPSKYSSNQNQKAVDSSITGKRVVQPKLIVQGEGFENSDMLKRMTPSKVASLLNQSKISKRKNAKKSKSQTIQANSSQNLKLSQTGRGNKTRRFREFLDTSILPPQANQSKEKISANFDDEKDLTLRILHSSADIVQKYAKQRQHSSDRNKVQMKYLNFHRKNVTKGKSNKRSSTTLRERPGTTERLNERKDLNKSQNTSADKINRLTGSFSPKSKTGSGISRTHVRDSGEIPLQNTAKEKSSKKHRADVHLLAKSAVDIPAGISTILLDRGNHNESDLSMVAHFKKQQNNSAINGANDQSNMILMPQKNQKSGPDVKRHRISISPDRVQKIDKIIRDNIRKELQAQEQKRKEMREREASSQKRRTLLEQKNQNIRKFNNEKIQRRHLKLKENIASWHHQDANETKLLEEALLATSDGVQQNKDKESDSRMKQIGNRTLQLQQKNALQNRISQVMQEMPHPSQHGRTQGMDFIDVRREIQNELRAVGSTGIVKTKVSKKLLNQGDGGNQWIDSTLNLQTSKSQKQDFSQLRQQIHTTSLSVHQQPPEKKRVFGNLSMIKNENMLCKREKIRKFMKEKARLMQNKAEQQRLSELKTFKKVRCNLKQLNEFVQSKMGQSSGITTPALKVKRPQIKKQIVAQENEERPKKGQNIQDRNITPQRTGLFEQSDVSLNISAKRAQSRSALGQQNQKDIQKLHDTLYEDSRLSSIDAHDERSAKRNQVNKVLSVCFEKSASQKALRKSFRQQHSPQILKQRGGQQKSRPQSALSLQGNKINNSSKQRKAKSAPKRQKSGCTRRFILPSQGKVSGMHLNTDEQSENDEDKDVTLNLKLTDQAAAVVIQKEVRKFLANLGFYEARKVNQNGESQQSPRLHSPDRNNVIDLYIRPKSNSSKRSSPLIQNSRKKGSTSGKRDKSPDYELLDPSQSNSNFKVKISPQQLKNILRQELNDPNYQIQPAQQIKTEFKKIEPSEPSLFDKLPSHSNQSLLSAERKRASEDVKRPVGLINRIKNGVNNKSSAASSQVPALWGLHSVSTPLSDQTGQNQDANQVLDAVSQSSSMFDRNSFQQFSQQRLTNLMRNNEYQKLIHFREECLIFRERKEKKHIQKLLQDNQMTPKTYKQRQQQIERWVSLQRLEIEQTKLGFKEEWEKTVQMVEDTQKNVDQLKIKMNSARNADSNSYSQASSRHNSKPPRQILIDEAPKSYRSGRHEPHQVKISDLDPSLGQLTSRDSQKIEDLINNQLFNQKPQSEKSDQKIFDPKQIISPSHQKSSSGGDLDNLIQPSVAFINRLEKAAHGLLPRDSSNEGTLNIEEHDYLDDFGDDGKNIPQQTDTFDNFKNRIMQMKDLNQLFSGESQGNSDAQSDHKSEPMVESADNGKEEVKISDMLNKRADLKQSLNYQEEIIAPIVPQPELNVLHSQMADQITDALMQQLLKDCLQVPKRSKEKVQPPPLPDQDVYTVDSYSIDREEKKEWIEIRQRHVIEANLIRCDQYVNELVDVLLQFDISDISENSDFDYEVKPNDNFHIQFLKLLTQPIQRPPSETLELMQKSELGSYQHFETTLDASKHPIVSVDLYLEIEKAREESMLARKSTADARKLQIWESIHIYNKCIFDSVNESLMKFRPYGIVGQPMPWSNKVRRLQTKVEIASVDTERLFQMVKQEIFRWSQVFCGCLPGPVFYFPNPRTGKDEFQEDLFQEVRERRLTSVLTQDTVEQEHHWLNYEFEETQVKVDLSDMILEVLVGEVISLLRNQEQ